MSADPVAALSQLLAADAAAMDAASVAEGCAAIGRLRGLLDAVEARLVGRLSELHAAGSSAAPIEVLSSVGNVSGREARRQVTRANTVEQLPELAGALAAGVVSGSHADAIGRTAARLDDTTRDAFFGEGALLVEAAQRLSPEAFERHCRRFADMLGNDGGTDEFERQRRATRLRHWIDHESGMYQLRAELDPETGAALFGALDGEIERLFHGGGADTAAATELSTEQEHLAAHALARLVHRAHHGSHDGPVTAEVSVLVDARTLLDGLHEHGICELDDGTPIPADTARRLACDAGITPVVFDGAGVAIDVGRAQRLATTAQRKALRAMYPRCGFDGCDVPYRRCQPHHLRPWDTGGTTDLVNLVPLCRRHHHLVHEGRWRLDLDPATRDLTITRPDGRIHSVTPLRPLAAAA
jgi:hypothetical protein